MVILGEDAQTHTDTETTRLIPEDAVLRLDRGDIPGNLVVALESLLDAPEKIDSYAAAAARLAGDLLQPWDARIAREVELIRHLANQGDPLSCRTTAL